jgi:two-component system, OmpR family, phosphate regulon sensor histidine kinase PhoR
VAPWTFALVRLLALLAIALLGGLVFGRPYLWVSGVLAGYLCWQLVNLYRLDRWLRLRNELNPPDLGGIWGEVVSNVVRLHRRKNFHKRRILHLFREFRRSTAAMPDGVIVLNAEREILWFNRTAARLLALKRKVDFSLRIDNLIRHPDFRRYLDEGRFEEPITIGSPLTPQVRLSLHGIPYGDTQQLLLVRDVTRQARLESLRRDFVANASHELRSPLTVISGYLDTLADDSGVDAAWRGPFDEMRRQADRMRQIVDDLLELSRLEASGEEAAEDLVDVPGMLALIRREVLAVETRPETVELHLDSNARLLGAESELHSAFANLVTNAVKYTPASGRIDIRWWTDDEGAHLAVRDTGIGIPEEHLPRLTERFYRIDPGRARQTGGSGLGLAIVKHALQRHGATLSVESEVGRGSMFTCHFPQRRVVTRDEAAGSAA